MSGSRVHKLKTRVQGHATPHMKATFESSGIPHFGCEALTKKKDIICKACELWEIFKAAIWTSDNRSWPTLTSTPEFCVNFEYAELPHLHPGPGAGC